MSELARYDVALEQRWPLPSRPRPIVLLGAGGIVNDAHLPAYRACGFDVRGCFDLDRDRARATAERWQLAQVYDTLEQALLVPDAVFDMAVPPQAILELVRALPRGAPVLIQKPLGLDLAQATAIRAQCRARDLSAAVNLQLRFSPLFLAIRELKQRDVLGRIVELEVRVNCRMPWELWPFLASLERMELPLHSIHYLDAIRSLLGEPRGVWGRTVKHPSAPQLASSRSTLILEYGDDVRCALSINHHHEHGPRHQASEIRIEGTRGALVGRMGVNLDYPRGRPDALELALERSETWLDVPLAGNWFPDAFRGPMSNLQRFVAGEDANLWTSVEDSWRTMQVIEALYASDASRGTRLPFDPVPAPKPAPRPNGGSR